MRHRATPRWFAVNPLVGTSGFSMRPRRAASRQRDPVCLRIGGVGRRPESPQYAWKIEGRAAGLPKRDRSLYRHAGQRALAKRGPGRPFEARLSAWGESRTIWFTAAAESGLDDGRFGAGGRSLQSCSGRSFAQPEPRHLSRFRKSGSDRLRLPRGLEGRRVERAQVPPPAARTGPPPPAALNGPEFV